MMTWATERLEALRLGQATLPAVVKTMRLGTLDEWGDGWIRKSWAPAPELLNADGTLFGGYLAALADQALAFAAMTAVPAEAAFRTVNLQLGFIRVARAEPLAIEARLVATTKQMITARAEFRRPDGELVAEAAAQQLIVPLTR